MHFNEWKFFILIWISQKFVPEGPINNKSSLAEVMAWCQSGNKPLPNSMKILFTDTYVRHYGEVN